MKASNSTESHEWPDVATPGDAADSFPQPLGENFQLQQIASTSSRQDGIFGSINGCNYILVKKRLLPSVSMYS